MDRMISTSALVTEEYYDIDSSYSTLKIPEGPVSLTDLELLVTDSETGRPISRAMVSIDAIGRTAVCDVQGNARLERVLSGRFMIDVIMFGYMATSTIVHLSSPNYNRVEIKMVSNS